ncbi:hypothetical protein [Chelativorans sp. YIM 93263]|uniref:hypothetical protein n=1 Tax=Chelativorans sp. YIM 93263 TaxID=2906648 RepID=UPI0023784144|nr:hypothetical protein [Chelativorans sp. YIM 93263]
MRIALPLLLGLFLVGCQNAETQDTRAPQPRRSGNDAGEAPFFVGHWAASEDACETIPWEFTETRLSTPGEVTCTFEEVKQVPEGYEIAGTCTAEGPPEPYSLALSQAESTEGLLVEGGPFNPVGLVACE